MKKLYCDLCKKETSTVSKIQITQHDSINNNYTSSEILEPELCEKCVEEIRSFVSTGCYNKEKSQNSAVLKVDDVKIGNVTDIHIETPKAPTKTKTEKPIINFNKSKEATFSTDSPINETAFIDAVKELTNNVKKIKPIEKKENKTKQPQSSKPNKGRRAEVVNGLEESLDQYSVLENILEEIFGGFYCK